MGISENAAYLKGLFEGYEIDATKKEGKIISGLLDLVINLSEEVDALADECKELREYIEELDYDLGDVESAVFEIEDEEYDDDDEDFEDEFLDDFEGITYNEYVCPSCGTMINVEDTCDIEKITCPACGEVFGEDFCDGNCDACEETDCEDKKND